MKIDLPPDIKIPYHLAIIPDGNRRWAKKRGLPAFMGHRQGFKRLKELCHVVRKWGIHTMTIWAFSTENWQRNKSEVNYLMKLYQTIIKSYLKEAQEEGIKIVHLGRKDRIPQQLAETIAQAEKITQKNTNHILNIALDYGGRDEIIRAVEKAKRSKLKTQSLNEDNFNQFLDTSGQPYPYPDLLVRTSGEIRTSGFLPWQISYTEFYFTQKHLPDFTVEDLKEAILEYDLRERRQGK